MSHPLLKDLQSPFLDIIKDICSERFPTPQKGDAPLAARGLCAWKEARALTVEEAEDVRPVWARAKAGDLILSTRDHLGQIVGARLWTMEGARFAPLLESGLATSGAVLCNYVAVNWLQGAESPACLMIAEGEPDFATLCILADKMMERAPHVSVAIMGIYSGAWSKDFGERAGEVINGVVIATDRDKAGEGYAGKIRASIKTGTVVRWLGGSGSEDINDCFLIPGFDMSHALFGGAAMPPPPSEDEGRWAWTDAAGWAEDPSWAAARAAEKAWAAAQAIPRERLGDAMLERARKYADAKLANVAAELAQTKGDRERACKLIAPLASYVAGGALDKATVEVELEHAYADGEAADVRKDRKLLIKSLLKSGKNGQTRTPITLEDIAAKLAADDDEKRREDDARRKRQEESKRQAPKQSREAVEIEPATAPLPSALDASSVENWHEEIDAMGWDRTPSEVELAHRLLDYLTPPGMPSPVAAEGALWRYSPSKGIWVNVQLCDVARIISRWDGAQAANGKRVRIGKKTAENALGMAMYLVDDPQFFKNTPRGIMLGDRFIEVDTVKKTVREVPPSPDHRARHKVEAVPSKPGDMLNKYLATVHEGEDAQDKVRLMGEVAFAALCGLGTTYKKAILCHGGKGSGKSQFLHIVQSLVPDSAKITVMPQDMGEDYHCASLAGKTLNMVGELEAEDFMREGKFKSIVHGEAVQARNPSEKVFQLWPIALHLINANTLPSAPGVSQAFWDRWLVVGFERSWTDSDRSLLEGGVDEIGKRLTDEDMGGLLSWVLDCGKALVERGKYTIPTTSRDLMKQWQVEADTVSSWLDERCDLLTYTTKHDQWELSDAAYKDYAMYCEGGNHRPVNIKKFKDRMLALGVRRTKSGRGFIWAIRLTVRM